MTDPILTLNDGRTMPQIGFGLWQVPAERTAEVVVQGLAAGYRMIDGAAIYGNEEGLGEGLKRTDVPRDQVFVQTKVWNSEQGFDSALRAAEELRAAENAQSTRDASASGPDPLGEVVASGTGTDADAGDYLQD